MHDRDFDFIRVNEAYARADGKSVDYFVGKPDLILLDINLPEMTGYEALRRIKQNDGLAEVPIVAVSANAMESDIEKGLSAGFNDYITKPIDVNNFLNSIETILH